MNRHVSLIVICLLYDSLLTSYLLHIVWTVALSKYLYKENTYIKATNIEYKERPYRY